MKYTSPNAGLAALTMASAIAYAAIASSGQSLHEEGSGGHSLLAILALFGVCFACYLAATAIALRSPSDRKSLTIIVGGAVVFRGLLLFSDPIEEIDIYRYLWDGAASASGVNPFRYAPQQVMAANAADNLPGDLARLVALRDRSPVWNEILSRLHFGELPTIYPPVSQVIFALATAMTPNEASLTCRMTIIKAWFVGFDLLTILVVFRLLRLSKLPASAIVIYAWCPLVIKEIANSGHLDSLAVFLTTLSVYVAAKALFPEVPQPLAWNKHRWALLRGASWSAFLLGLAIGAKLYPAVLAPCLLICFAVRTGWRDALASGIVLAVTAALVLFPMFPTGAESRWKPPASVEQTGADLPPLPPEETDLSPRDPSQSLRAFLSYWEMNDFIFLIVMENVRSTAQLPPQQRAWFSIVPERWRLALINRLRNLFPVDADVATFVFTRAVTLAAFVLLASTFTWRAARASTAEQFLRCAFLTIAWFWLLLPTGNPWYWTWAMPLVPFARSRAWLALSGLVMLYYLRFWLVFHFREIALCRTPYTGSWFFDYVVTWIEFGPWFGWLLVDVFSATSRSWLGAPR